MDAVVDVAAALVRALSFVTVLAAAGIALFVSLYRGFLDSSLKATVSLGRRLAFAACVLVIITQALQAARMAGEFSGIADIELERYSWSLSIGTAAIVRAFGALLIAWGLARSTNVARLIGVTLVVVSFPLTGHTSTQDDHWLLQILLAAHLAAVCYWFGALPALLRALRAEPLAQAARVIAVFSRDATVVFLALGAAGAVIAFMLLPGLFAFTQPYGRLLLVKIVGYTALLVLASWNKLRLTPGLARGESEAVGTLRRSIGAELTIACVVLVATAWMTAFYSPEPD
jgi:putative copper export protein